LQKYLYLFPSDAIATLFLAICCLKAGRTEESLRNCQLAVQYWFEQMDEFETEQLMIAFNSRCYRAAEKKSHCATVGPIGDIDFEQAVKRTLTEALEKSGQFSAAETLLQVDYVCRAANC
tara:strand:- start:5814 stop:6173 length:360 start_codon:yes stop_codon:yes gene_type:complete